jgi:ribosomal protein S18 acetylase RimI-like enzyme
MKRTENNIKCRMEFYKLNIDASKAQAILVVVKGACAGSIIASCMINDWEKPYVWLSWFNVLPQYRRKGVGTFMLREILVYCKGKRKKNVSLSVVAKNKAALAMYRKGGMKESQLNGDELWMVCPMNQE